MKPPEKLVEARLNAYAVISDNSSFEALETRSMAKEILEFRGKEAQKKTSKKYSKSSKVST